MQKLLNLARRIAPSIKNSSSASSVYQHIKNDTFLKNVYGALEAQEIIYLSFLIQGFKDGKDLEEVSQKCQRDLFSFSIIQVSTDHPNETCYNCGGNGQIDCYNCDGDGEIDCGECDGSGTDDEGDSCSYCDGDGKDECDECGGNGHDSCDDCDSSGEQEDTISYDIDQMNYVSINRDLFITFETMEEFTEIDESDFGNYVIQVSSDNRITQNNQFEDEMGNTLFGEVSPTPALRKSTFRGIVDDSLFDIS